MTLKEWRKSQGLTLQQVAELLVTSKGYLSSIENGKRAVGRDFAIRLERLTGGEVSAAELLGLDSARRNVRSVSEERTEFGSASSEVDQAHLEEAAAYGLDVDAITRKAVEEAVKAERIRRWNEDNREAIESWNDLVEREGLWSDGIRAF
ncbi:MAG: type II toxin-antitoxin system CcdA family antitoxin [Hyphomonas sp.]|nr:type II toxin-antitoxin system CcdA family antitoxin [Hyphomonas sp.]